MQLCLFHSSGVLDHSIAYAHNWKVSGMLFYITR